MSDDRDVLIIGPNPTPNGDMHLGHIAGPYLGGDVYARYQRALGRDVVYTTGTDDSQTFVTATARRRGITAEELCATATQQIRDTLSDMGISVDGFGPFDDTYVATVLEFFRTLHEQGKLKLSTVRLPYLAETDEFIVDGLICGNCPVCLAECRGGLCESCGHPNMHSDLLDSRSTVMAEHRPVAREVQIMVLPLEEYREQLTEYHARNESSWRPHIVQLARETLAKPLPDFPVTYPLGWGIPAPFPETPGQVLNSWAETIPAGFFTSTYAAEQSGKTPGPPGTLWLRENDRRLVHFLGFDNAWFWSVAYVGLLFAHGDRYTVPDTIVPNEFYELENEKFSTSKGNVVWCRDLLDEMPRDLVRLYLASTAPEHQRTTFNRAGLAKVTGDRLVVPWNRVAGLLAKAFANTSEPDVPLPVSEQARWRVNTMLDRFDQCYEFPGYSLTRAAELLLVQLDRLRGAADRLEGRTIDADPAAFGDLFHEVTGFLAAASPILIDLALAAERASGTRLSLARSVVTELRPFAPPLLERCGGCA
jgi:methionyl-tRNA synthetase